MEFIKKQSNKILLSAGAVALLLGGYYYLKHSKKPIAQQYSPQQDVSANASYMFVKDDKYNNLIQKLKPIVESELQVGDLSKQTIITINQAVIHVFKSEYTRILLEGRRIRRKYLDNIETYVREFMKYSTEAEKLMENASLEVLKDLDISMEAYERSSEKIMQADPNFAMFNLYMFESVKMQVPSDRSKVLTKNDLVNILKFQKDHYNEIDLGNLDVGPEQLIMIKQTYVSDKASFEFDYEEEDIMKNPSLMQDPEVMEVQKELQNVMLSEQANMNYFG